MEMLLIEDLDLPMLMGSALKLEAKGKLAISSNNLIYLDTDDEYIHRLFPLLDKQQIKKPEYFGAGLAGAHISVIYPEENISISSGDLYKEHSFAVKGVFAAKIGHKKYYALMIHAPSLLLLRRKYGLSDLLPFKNYLIGFHITIGVQLVS